MIAVFLDVMASLRTDMQFTSWNWKNLTKSTAEEKNLTSWLRRSWLSGLVATSVTLIWPSASDTLTHRRGQTMMATCNTEHRRGGVVIINGEEGTHWYSVRLDFCSWSAVASGAPSGSSEDLCPRTSVRISMFCGKSLSASPSMILISALPPLSRSRMSLASNMPLKLKVKCKH